MRRVLEYQADQIEMVLYSHKVPARVLGGVVTPRWVRFEVMPALGAKVNSIVRLSEEIALSISSSMWRPVSTEASCSKCSSGTARIRMALPSRLRR